MRFLTAGESHGPCVTAIVEGAPAGLPLDEDKINVDLRRRQGGYGRGARQEIERDRVRFLGGVSGGMTIGSPLSLLVTNKDWENWREREVPAWTRPRPGHADLVGSQKYGIDDLRLVAERASARETAARVAAGAVAKALLNSVNARVGSYVKSIGTVRANVDEMSVQERCERALLSDVYCPDEGASAEMRRLIDATREAGDSLGGVFVVVAWNVPVGLGSYVHWDRRLDARLAQAIVGIQAVKGAEIGEAFANARRPGSEVQDALYPGAGRPRRRTNRAGGLEGGVSNGEPILVRAAMKPIPTTLRSIPTVDLETGEATETQYQRSDVCAVPAASVVGEAMVAWVLADALLARYGEDTMKALVERVRDER